MKKFGIIGLLSLCIAFLSGYGALNTSVVQISAPSSQLSAGLSDQVLSYDQPFHVQLLNVASTGSTHQGTPQLFETVTEDLDLDFFKKIAAGSSFISTQAITLSFANFFSAKDQITHYTAPLISALSNKRYLTLQVFRI